jgi:hypothetical protein
MRFGSFSFALVATGETGSRSGAFMNAGGSICVWRDLYEAAILENDKSRLPHRIRIAKSAICDRVEELPSAGGFERADLHWAWAALNALEEIHSFNHAKTA